MTINKVRSTDDPTGRPMPFIMRTAEDARNAPPPTYHCGWCSFSSPDTDHRAIRDRSCLSPTGKINRSEAHPCRRCSSLVGVLETASGDLHVLQPRFGSWCQP